MGVKPNEHPKHGWMQFPKSVGKENSIATTIQYDNGVMILVGI
jgi:hypothetical protein